jgi:hypothetical protein
MKFANAIELRWKSGGGWAPVQGRGEIAAGKSALYRNVGSYRNRLLRDVSGKPVIRQLTEDMDLFEPPGEPLGLNHYSTRTSKRGP